MPIYVKVLQPAYLDRFRCLASDCEDTCCSGWGVVVDKATYNKYRRCKHTVLRPLMDEFVKVDPQSTSDQTYARIEMRENACPFLGAAQLCMIQQDLGASALSRACSMYPRAVNVVDGRFERSLYLSCPEAARLVLLDPTSMELVERSLEPGFKFAAAPTVETGSPEGDKPYEHFTFVREIVASLIRNRMYQFWERLVILGLFCEHVDRIVRKQSDESLGAVLAAYYRQIQQGFYRGALKNVPFKPEDQVRLMVRSLDGRALSKSSSTRFSKCYRQITEALSWSADADIETVGRRYADAHSQFYKPFMDRNAHILENLVLNYTFRSLFPFGPQKGVYREERSIYAEYVLLVAHYCLVRSLLVGYAGYHQGDFGSDHVVRVVQSFGRAIEHDLPFMGRVVAYMDERDMTNLVYLASLIRS